VEKSQKRFFENKFIAHSNQRIFVPSILDFEFQVENEIGEKK